MWWRLAADPAFLLDGTGRVAWSRQRWSLRLATNEQSAGICRRSVIARSSKEVIAREVIVNPRDPSYYHRLDRLSCYAAQLPGRLALFALRRAPAERGRKLPKRLA